MYRQLWYFTLAGAIGFVVDVAVLYLMLQIGLGYYAGRAVSFLCAAFTTWQLNRRFAFSARAGEALWREWLRYLVAMLGGGAVNYAIYSLLVLAVAHEPWLPLVAVAAGSAGGLLVNFLSARFWVFRKGGVGGH